ncbi:hypothetical protein [Flaviaesturariibacter aridisoli]|uniref:Uncharacterized protein n=1 Tax=Flaviaesturariibacter aridisoli TaxID=2545761 RepID=A0A4R4E5T3_9BACT|nr:hypothetical protein [Flaviaesturariibacter aridisoli]TCZ74387.1 hypothetical protein E0486_01820 [Flaviaesturariibacter aridisoli]
MRASELRMNKRLFLVLMAGLAGAGVLRAQDTLPRFHVRNAGSNRSIVSWTNPYPNIAQISIQRAFDSLGTYKTVLSVADPKSVQNGYTDRNAPNDHMWYRLFYAMEGGTYYFTKPRRPDTSRVQLPQAQRPVVTPNDLLYKYKDSVFVRNRDTFVVINHDTLRVKNNDTLSRPKPGPAPVVKKPEWVPSTFVFANSEGYVQLRLPDAAQKNYSVKFYEDSTFLFEIKSMKDRLLLLDKSNFYHSGWFFFELYNDDKLVERNKFYLKP